MQQQRTDGLTVSDDPTLLDVDRMSGWLAESYWASDRDRATVARSLEGSRTFGVYTADGLQVAVARVVTDGVTFAWICDVVVDADWRGRGVGTWLMGAVVAELRRQDLKRIVLTTRDAHGVYEQVGFSPLRVPSTWMEIDMRATRPEPVDGTGPTP